MAQRAERRLGMGRVDAGGDQRGGNDEALRSVWSSSENGR